MASCVEKKVFGARELVLTKTDRKTKGEVKADKAILIDR